MIGVRTEGPSDGIAATLQAMPDIDYLVVTAGSFDLMCEVVVGDDADLLDLTNRIRRVPGVSRPRRSSISISSSRRSRGAPTDRPATAHSRVDPLWGAPSPSESRVPASGGGA